MALLQIRTMTNFNIHASSARNGPCAISGGGWQLVTVPLTDFLPDNSFVFGGNDILDTQPVADGGNGQLETMVVAVISTSGDDATFRTDYWVFKDLIDTDSDSVVDSIDNCAVVANGQQTDSDGDMYGNACDADFNNDGVVNGLDVGTFVAQFGTGGPDADFNGDGVVNGLDVGPFVNMFGQAPGAQRTGSVARQLFLAHTNDENSVSVLLAARADPRTGAFV